MKFEDLHDYAGTHHYLIPNEDKLRWRELVKYLRVQRAAGICSSGEVGLISLLPSVRQELVLVDHSYRSLSIAMVKYIIIREYGATEAIKIFTSSDAGRYAAALRSAVEQLPERVRAAYETLSEYSGGSFYLNGSQVKSEWDSVRTPTTLVQKAWMKLNKVTFVHGDLTDLIPKGPFDLLYISNALEHYGREGTPVVEKIAKIVKPGGFVIGCGQRYSTRCSIPDDWEKIKSVESGYSPTVSGQLNWTHTLYRTPQKAAA